MALQYQILPVTPYQQNCTLLWCTQTKEAVLIDAGGDAETLKQAVRDENLTMVAIWMTHGHLDHVGAMTTLAAHYQVPIIGAHKAEQFWLDQLPAQSQRFGWPAMAAFTPTQWLAAGDTVKVGKESLTALHCPGHTPGHVVFHSATAKILIVGDVLFAGSIGRSDFPKGNHEQLVTAIRTQLFTLPPETVVLPGHGPKTTLAQERKNNPFVADRLFTASSI